jgi:hypothetical protein
MYELASHKKIKLMEYKPQARDLMNCILHKTAVIVVKKEMAVIYLPCTASFNTITNTSNDNMPRRKKDGITD